MICQRVESAVLKWLLEAASPSESALSSFALATDAESVTVVPTGLLVSYGDADSFTLNFYAGESEERQELPKVVVVSTQGTPEEDCPSIHRVPVEVTLCVEADSRTGFDSTAWLEQASRWLHGQISMTRGAMDGLERVDPYLVVSHVGPAETGRAPDGRKRIHRWQFDVVASLNH